MGKCTFSDGECCIKKDNLCCFDCDDLEKCKYLCGYIKHVNYDTSKKCKCEYFKEESNEIKHNIPKCKLNDCSLNEDNTCCFYCDDFEECKDEEIVCDHALSYNTAEGCPYLNHIIEESEPDTSNKTFKYLYRSNLLSLSKEDLIQIIAMYHSCYCKIGETCVEESKDNIDSNSAVERIRDYLKEVDFKFYDEEMLKRMIK